MIEKILKEITFLNELNQTAPKIIVKIKLKNKIR